MTGQRCSSNDGQPGDSLAERVSSAVTLSRGPVKSVPKQVAIEAAENRSCSGHSGIEPFDFSLH
jgi:hypothetical protein